MQRFGRGTIAAMDVHHCDPTELASGAGRRERAIRGVNGEAAEVMERLATHAQHGTPPAESQLQAVAMMLRRGAFTA